MLNNLDIFVHLIRNYIYDTVILHTQMLYKLNVLIKLLQNLIYHLQLKVTMMQTTSQVMTIIQDQAEMIKQTNKKISNSDIYMK